MAADVTPSLLHNTALMPLRLTFALALSLALHGGLLLPDILKRPSVAPPPPALQALLRLPPKPEAQPAEPLLKNALDSDEAPPTTKPQPPSTPQAKSVNTLRRDVQVAQKKLSKTQFYPPQAVTQGIEGDVRLILNLAADGSVDDVGIAASSGHAILDNAAVKAAYAMGRLTGVTSRELILPVIFRLQ
jgi:periplasmic protein TonB